MGKLLESNVGSSARGEDRKVSLRIDLDDLQSRDGGKRLIPPSDPGVLAPSNVGLWNKGHGENSTFFDPLSDDAAENSAEDDGDSLGVSSSMWSATLEKYPFGLDDCIVGSLRSFGGVGGRVERLASR